MGIDEVLRIFKWLEENFEDNFMYVEKLEKRKIDVMIYDEDIGWNNSKTLFFNENGVYSPKEYRKKEIEEQIKELQKELENL